MKMLYTKQLNLNLDDLPFEGSYVVTNEEFKDEFGNTVKHIARYLAKLGLKEVTNHE
jgi:DUF438 domain-containing protein